MSGVTEWREELARWASYTTSTDFGEVWTSPNNMTVILDVLGTPSAYCFLGDWENHDDVLHVPIDHPGELGPILGTDERFGDALVTR